MSMDIEPGAELTQEQYNWLKQRDRVEEAVNIYGCTVPDSVETGEAPTEPEVVGNLATMQTAGPSPAQKPGTMESVHPDQVGTASPAGGVVLIEDLENSGGDSDEVPPYEEWDKADLQAEVDRRNSDRDAEDDDYIVVTGTGKDGNVLKADLVSALEADDALDETITE